MLGWMRRQTRSWFVYIAFGVIIVVFVFFYGWRGRGSGEQAVIALVNSQKITRRLYNETYKNLLTISRSIYKRSLTEEEIKQLRQRALEELIERTLMIQEAGRFGLTVSLDEVRSEIAKATNFQRGGVFNKELYLRQLAASHMSPGEFEKVIRANMLISKLRDIFQETSKFSDNELFALYELENERVSLKFLKIRPLDFEGKVEISPEEIKEHYKNTKERYRIPDRVKARYLSFDPKLYKERVAVKQEEIEEFYRLNEDRFFQKGKVRASHILIEFKGKEGSKAEEEARKRAEKIRERIEKGEDFSKLAKFISQDTATASKGGDLGYFERGQMLKPFEDAAFSLKPGDISPVVRTQRGFHIIKLVDIQGERLEPLEKVKGVIEEEIKKERADDFAREEARRAFGKIYRGGDLADYSEKNGLSLHESSFFSEGDEIEGIGINKDFSEAALLLKRGEVSPIINVGGRYLILQLIDREESYLPSLKEVKQKVIKSLLKEKAKKMARKKAEELLGELISGTPMERIASREGLIIEETEPFTRKSGFIDKIGSSKELVKEAFTLSSQRPFLKKVYEIRENYYIIKLKKREGVDQKEFQSKREEIPERYLAQKMEERIKLWVKGLRDRAEIKTFLRD